MLIREKFKNCDFSESEQKAVDLILKEKLNIRNLSIREIAQRSFTVSSTLIRISHKMGYSGWKELKRAYLQEETYLASHVFEVDANIPFQKSDSILTIANKIAALKKDSIDDTLSLIEYQKLQEAVRILDHADSIHIFGISQNPLLAETFRYRMLRIHHNVFIHNIQNDLVYESHLIDADSAVLVISYTGESPVLVKAINVVRRNNIPVVSLTSIGDNRLSRLSDIVLHICTREKLYSKIATYSTDESISLILDILYSSIYRSHYTENLDESLQYSRATESRDTVNNPIISEKPDKE